jgi:DNA-binding NarL/FixJ family response regulator
MKALLGENRRRGRQVKPSQMQSREVAAVEAGQLRGVAPLPSRLPVTAGVERVFLDRARRLSPDAQRLLVVAAADDSARVPTVLQAATRLGVDAGALTEVERSGLVTVVDDRLVLRHPLVRSALYSAATTADRLAVHGALAEVLTRQEDADRRAWHRSASVVEPDEHVVNELVDAASRAQRRGGHEAASAAWARAAELSSEAEPRAERLYLAALAAWVAGRPGRAKQLVDAALREATDPLVKADSSRLRARVEWNTGSVALAHRMLLEAAREVAPHDQDRAREIGTEATAIAVFGGDSGIGLDPLSFTEPPPADATARQRCFAQLLHGLRHVLAGEWPQAAASLRQAFKIASELEGEYQLLPNLGIAALHIGDLEHARRIHEQLLTEARNSGVMVMVLYALTRLGFSDLARGAWSDGVAHAREAVSLGEETGQRVLAAAPRAWLLLFAALRGEDTFEGLAEDLERVTRGDSAGILNVVLRDLVFWAHAVRSFHQPSIAFHQLGRMTLDITKRAAGMDRIDAAVRAGQPEAAGLWVADLEMFAEATGQRWPAAVAAHGRALLAGDDSAEAQFERALALHAEEPRPFDRARTELAYGEFLRRSRRRVDARTHLRAALQTFQDLQAGPWADRASQELRASGETVRRQDGTGFAELTPQERQVAQLVKRGMSNREVAAQLFVSPRTVDFHLRNVFTKTGVTSRVELAGLALG